MKKLGLAICLLFLVGCKGASDPIQGALDFRTTILQSQTISFSGETMAHMGDLQYGFTLSCAYDVPSGSSRVEITSPQELSGIVATTQEGTTLVYEDVVLALDHNQPSAMLLAKLLGDGWCNGYIQCADEDGTTTYALSNMENMTLLTFFDEENHPYFCEIYEDTNCILTATLTDFDLQ